MYREADDYVEEEEEVGDGWVVTGQAWRKLWWDEVARAPLSSSTTAVIVFIYGWQAGWNATKQEAWFTHSSREIYRLDDG